MYLEDGRSVHVPLEWFAKPRDASPDELAAWPFIGHGVGIHWPKLDEDLSVRGLLLPEQLPQRMSAERSGSRGAAARAERGRVAAAEAASPQ